MVERAAAGEAPSSPQPPEAGARRARLYGALSATDNRNRGTCRRAGAVLACRCGSPSGFSRLWTYGRPAPDGAARTDCELPRVRSAAHGYARGRRRGACSRRCRTTTSRNLAGQSAGTTAHGATATGATSSKSVATLICFRAAHPQSAIMHGFSRALAARSLSTTRRSNCSRES